MKPLLIFVCILLLFSRCSNSSSDVNGLYVSSSTNEFASVDDSLFVQQSRSSDFYEIDRRTFIDYLRQDERQPQHRRDNWMAVYDVKTKTLSVQQNGKSLYFDEEKDGIYLGKTFYKKVSDESIVDKLVAGSR